MALLEYAPRVVIFIAAVVVSEINDTGELFFSCGWLVCI